MDDALVPMAHGVQADCWGPEKEPALQETGAPAPVQYLPAAQATWRVAPEDA